MCIRDSMCTWESRSLSNDVLTFDFSHAFLYLCLGLESACARCDKVHKALLTCSAFTDTCPLVDTGATNFLLDMSMISSEATHVRNTSVTLASGQQQPSVWRAKDLC
eukprot:774204-Amphidinium_carterae.4